MNQILEFSKLPVKSTVPENFFTVSLNSEISFKKPNQMHLFFSSRKLIFQPKGFCVFKKNSTFVAPGEMAEWSNAAVLKTVVPRGTGGSNPSLSAKKIHWFKTNGFFVV